MLSFKILSTNCSSKLCSNSYSKWIKCMLTISSNCSNIKIRGWVPNGPSQAKLMLRGWRVGYPVWVTNLWVNMGPIWQQLRSWDRNSWLHLSISCIRTRINAWEISVLQSFRPLTRCLWLEDYSNITVLPCTILLPSRFNGRGEATSRERRR